MLPAPAITPAQIQQIRSELLRTLARIERSLKTSTSGSRPENLDQTCIGRLSRIEALQNQGLIQSLKERERIQLEQVVDALSRIEQGIYGICTACRTPIQSERLLVFPETRTCTPCGSFA